jgi:hypothetical protein
VRENDEGRRGMKSGIGMNKKEKSKKGKATVAMMMMMAIVVVVVKTTRHLETKGGGRGK